VPLRIIFEKLGANVEWIAQTQEIIAVIGDINIKMKLNSTKAYINNQ
jgi:hypothetical protein